MSPLNFEVFLIFPKIFSGLATFKPIFYNFFSRYQVPFYFWQIKSVLKHCKYYIQDCRLSEIVKFTSERNGFINWVALVSYLENFLPSTEKHV